MVLLFYVCEGPVIKLPAEHFKIKLDGLVERPVAFTLSELKERFPKVEVVAAMQVRETHVP